MSKDAGFLSASGILSTLTRLARLSYGQRTTIAPTDLSHEKDAVGRDAKEPKNKPIKGTTSPAF
jgi:hypothetical protein